MATLPRLFGLPNILVLEEGGCTHYKFKVIAKMPRTSQTLKGAKIFWFLSWNWPFLFVQKNFFGHFFIFKIFIAEPLSVTLYVESLSAGWETALYFWLTLVLANQPCMTEASNPERHPRGARWDNQCNHPPYIRRSSACQWTHGSECPFESGSSTQTCQSQVAPVRKI